MPRAKNSQSSAVSVDGSKLTDRSENPVWFKPVMFGFMLLGLVWILVFYISAGNYPVQALKEWNILVGFGIAFIGFLMTTRWR
ncbi:MAG: cell division protein CrgA [Microbacteriaceae bacterium]